MNPVAQAIYESMANSYQTFQYESWDELYTALNDPARRTQLAKDSGWVSTANEAYDAKTGTVEGIVGGNTILLNTFTFGGSDYIGLTNSEQYQGTAYAVSRVGSVVARECLITAATLGTAQIARGGIQGTSYSARAVNYVAQSRNAVRAAQVVTKGIVTYDVASGGYDIGKGVSQILDGDDWGYLCIAGGAFRAWGGFAGAREFTDVKLTESLVRRTYQRAIQKYQSQGLQPLVAGERADRLVKKWLKMFRNQWGAKGELTFDLRRNFKSGARGAEMDIVHDAGKAGWELKRSIKGVRPKQAEALEELFDDLDWKYIFGIE